MDFPLLLADTNVSFPGLGIKDLPISRIAFQIGSFPIYWYGICIVLAFIACVGLAMKQAKKFGLTSDHVIDFSLVIIPAAIVGARLYYVAFSWKTFSADFKSIFDIRDGGLAVLGGVILSFIAMIVFIKIRKLKIATVLDFLVVYIPLGQAIGRWGNFFNQEAFGTNTTLPWGMISESTTAYLKMYCPTLDANAPVHPTFLYESFCCSSYREKKKQKAPDDRCNVRNPLWCCAVLYRGIADRFSLHCRHRSSHISGDVCRDGSCRICYYCSCSLHGTQTRSFCIRGRRYSGHQYHS